MSTGSVQTYARIGGALILVSIVVGGFGEGVAPSLLVVAGDAAATAHNVVSSDLLLRAGFAAYLVEALCDVALTAVFYLLLRPVSMALALFAVLFRLMATATFAFAEVFYFAPSVILKGDSYLRAFTADQLNSLALLSFNVSDVGGDMSLSFYGLGSVLLGYLMFRSGYVPRFVGAAFAFGGLCFIARTFAWVLIPAVPTAILQLPMILALLVLAVWFLARGVDASRWEALIPTSPAPAGRQSA